MTDRPILIGTPAGPIGAAVTEPAGEPAAAVILLPGGGRRTGPNRLWAETARTLARVGVVVIRMDYPGYGDSDLVPSTPEADRDAVRHVGRWFAERTKGLDLWVVGCCYGGRLVGIVAEEQPVSRVALVAPYLRVRYPEARGFVNPKPGRASRWTRLQIPTRLRHTLRWILRKRPSVLDLDTAQSLADLSENVPMWILAGEHDVAARYVGAIRDLAARPANVDIDIVCGIAIHGHPTLEAQRETTDRVARWAELHIEPRERVAG